MKETKEMRIIYADTLIDLAERDESIVALEADLMKASGMAAFQQRFPHRLFDMGAAEANMVGTAAGLAAAGKKPYVHTFACFVSRRAYDQVFISAAYAKQNVKLVGSDPGIAAVYNGGTHMPFEDIGIMRNIPGMTILEPSDPVSLAALVRSNHRREGCSYMRLHRKAAPVLYSSSEEFSPGQGKVLLEGSDIALVASGVISVNQALGAAKILEEKNISAAVIDMPTVKPIDAELLLRYARKCGAVVTCENHQVVNGLGSAVAELLLEEYPVPFSRNGVQDEFGEVGDLEYLLNRFSLDAPSIALRAVRVVDKK